MSLPPEYDKIVSESIKANIEARFHQTGGDLGAIEEAEAQGATDAILLLLLVASMVLLAAWRCCCRKIPAKQD